jgi:hypothetical protein
MNIWVLGVLKKKFEVFEVFLGYFWCKKSIFYMYLWLIVFWKGVIGWKMMFGW